MSNYGILGWPLERSYSPKIHNFLFKQLSIDSNYRLIKLNEINNKNVEELNKNYSGYNVTIPYKEKIIEATKEPILDEHVKKIGSVNTVKNQDDETFFYNTDYSGFLYFFEIINFDVKSKKVFILGNGGSSKSIHYALSLLDVETTIVSRRNSQRTITYDDLNKRAKDVDVLINTTPVGMPPYENETLEIKYENFDNLEFVLNLGYGLNNTFLKKFDESILKYDGIGILICQAIESFNIWTSSNITIPSIYDDVHRVVSDFQALENEVSDLKWKVGDVERMLSDKIDEIRKRDQ